MNAKDTMLKSRSIKERSIKEQFTKHQSQFPKYDEQRKKQAWENHTYPDYTMNKEKKTKVNTWTIEDQLLEDALWNS